MHTLCRYNTEEKVNVFALYHESRPQKYDFKIFETQRKNPASKDWVSSVKKDLEELKLDFEFEDLKSIKKNDFKNILKKKIETNALEKLEKKRNYIQK